MQGTIEVPKRGAVFETPTNTLRTYVQFQRRSPSNSSISDENEVRRGELKVTVASTSFATKSTRVICAKPTDDLHAIVFCGYRYHHP